MDPWQVLLASDERHVLEFFVVGLRDVCGSDVDRPELLYNASVLAHYAQVSTQADSEWPAPTSLSTVFDQFVCGTHLLHDRVMLETAGAQCLLLTGFFHDQMRQRHNVRWYAELGVGFFRRATVEEPSRPKAQMLYAMASHFEWWRQRHAELSRALRDQPYLLPRTTPSRSM